MKQLIAVCGSKQSDDGALANIEVMRNIFDWETLPEKCDSTKEYDSFDWNISNKYYEANTQVCVVKSKSIISQEFSKHAEAVIIFFDSLKTHGMNELNQWLPFVNEWNCEIKMAVCEKCSSGNSSSDYLDRVKVQKWCIDNEFELVELNPNEEDFDEFEDFGTKRIRSALNAHIWPAMTMKSRDAATKPKPIEGGVKESTPTFDGAAAAQMDGLLLDDNDINSLLNDEDSGGESFEKLFEKLSVMKVNAAKVPEEQRVAYAENIVRAFWSAVGGDENELESSDAEEGEKK